MIREQNWISAIRKGPDTLNHVEHSLKLPVDFGLFGFGLANAGVALADMGHATWAVLGGFAIGKSAGIFFFSAVGSMLGFKLPTGMNFRSLFVAGMIAGLGLTMALFVSGVAYTDVKLIGAAKMGALLSVCIVPAAVICGKLLKVRDTSTKPKVCGSRVPLAVNS